MLEGGYDLLAFGAGDVEGGGRRRMVLGIFGGAGEDVLLEEETLAQGRNRLFHLQPDHQPAPPYLTEQPGIPQCLHQVVSLRPRVDD